MKNKKREATLLGYKIVFDSKGNLVTERNSIDLKHLKSLFSKRDYFLLRSILREAKTNIDKIHNKIEIALDARKQDV